MCMPESILHIYSTINYVQYVKKYIYVFPYTVNSNFALIYLWISSGYCISLWFLMLDICQESLSSDQPHLFFYSLRYSANREIWGVRLHLCSTQVGFSLPFFFLVYTATHKAKGVAVLGLSGLNWCLKAYKGMHIFSCARFLTLK